MKILIITPWVPYPLTGADQQDRSFGMKQMKEMGHNISVIAKIHDFQDRAKIEEAFRTENIPMMLVPHLKKPWKLFLKNLPRAIFNFALLDGAVTEYTDSKYHMIIRKEIERFKPDVIWIEYSSLWPVIRALKPLGIPIILKSSLNEPRNCIDEHGGSLLSRLKALPKYPGERIVAREADMVLAITPDEEAWYRALGAKKTATLPLRGLANCLETREHEAKQTLDVVFLSSNYNMGHNRDALECLLSIVPVVRKEMPGKFRFHLTGSKFPDKYKHQLADDVIYEGFIPNLGEFLKGMDIALCPWISGQGMQQKVFEPLCRSIPLLTTKTAGYQFESGKEVLLCKTEEDYVAGLRRLMSAEERNAVSSRAFAKAEELFSAQATAKIIESALQGLRK